MGSVWEVRMIHAVKGCLNRCPEVSDVGDLHMGFTDHMELWGREGSVYDLICSA